MVTFANNATSYTNFASTVEEMWANDHPQTMIHNIYNPRSGTGIGDISYYIPPKAPRELTGIDLDVVGGKQVNLSGAEIKKYAVSSTEEIGGEGYRAANNSNIPAVSTASYSMDSQGQAIMSSALSGISKDFEQRSIGSLFADLSINKAGAGFVSTTWEQRDGYRAGVGLDYTSLTTLEAKGAAIVEMINANQSDLIAYSGVAVGLVVIMSSEVATDLKRYLESKGRFIGATVINPAFPSTLTKGAFNFDESTVIMPVRKDILNSTGSPITYEFAMLYQNSVHLNYTHARDMWGEKSDDISNFFNGMSSKMGLGGQFNALSATSVANFQMNELTNIARRNSPIPFSMQYRDMVGFQFVENDPTASKSDTFEIKIHVGSGLTTGYPARKISFLSTDTATFEQKKRKNVLYGYHPDTIRHSERLQQERACTEASRSRVGVRYNIERFQNVMDRNDELEKANLALAESNNEVIKRLDKLESKNKKRSLKEDADVN